MKFEELKYKINNIPSLSDLSEVKRYRNFVFSAKYNKKDVHIKVAPTLEENTSIENERKILQKLNEQNVSVPSLIENSPTTIEGHSLIFTQTIKGVSLRDYYLNNDNPRAIREWATIKSQLHDLKFPHSDQNYYSYRKQAWINQLMNSEKFLKNDFESITKTFEAILKEFESGNYMSTLVQGDPSLENALFNSSTYLIDFESSIAGDPLWDLFGTVRDINTLINYKNAIKEAYSNDRVWDNHRINMIICLAAIDWLSLLSNANEKINNGYINGVSLEYIKEVGMNLYSKYRKKL